MIRSFLAFLVLFAQPANAVVDMDNANYAHTWTDLIIEGVGIDIEIERTYNSRSIFDGMFGFGWCSPMETKLEALPDGRLEVTECGGGLVVVYAKEDYSPQAYFEALDIIADAAQAANPDWSDARRAEYRDEIRQDGFLLRREAGKYRVSLPPEPNNVYNQVDSPAGHIVFDGKIFKRRLSSGWTQQFDSKGRLVRIEDLVGNYQRLHYEGNRLDSISDSFRRTLWFEYDENTGKVRHIAGSDGAEVHYAHAQNGELTEVKNAWGNTYTYEYDNLYNLVMIGFPDGTSRLMEYDVERDWIVRFTNREGCIEDYSYVSVNRLEYSSTVVKTCDGRAVARAAYGYFFEEAEGEGSYLSKFTADENGRREIIHFVPGFNRMSRRQIGSRIERFRYLPDGRIAQIATPDGTQVFEYMSTCLGPTSVITTTPGNSEPHERVWLTYDTATCGIAHVASASGITMQASYDRLGQLRQIRKSTGLAVEIDYDESTAEPTVIRSGRMPGLMLNRDEFGRLDLEALRRLEGADTAIAVISEFIRLTDLDLSLTWVGGCLENRSVLVDLVEELNTRAADIDDARSDLDRELEASPGIARCSP